MPTYIYRRPWHIRPRQQVIVQSLSLALTLEQESFRWRADDGSETTATWLDVQDANIIKPITDPKRIRIIVNTTNDAPAKNYRLEYRKGSGSWRKVT